MIGERLDEITKSSVNMKPTKEIGDGMKSVQ